MGMAVSQQSFIHRNRSLPVGHRLLTSAIKGGLKPNKGNVPKPLTLATKFREEGNRQEKYVETSKAKF